MLTLICVLSLARGGIHVRERVHYGMTQSEANRLARTLGLPAWQDARFGRRACRHVQQALSPEATRALATDWRGADLQTTTAED